MTENKLKKISKIIYDKMEKEYYEFLKNVSKKTGKEAIKYCYEIAYKRDILSVCEEKVFSNSEIIELLTTENLLDKLYIMCTKKDKLYYNNLFELTEIAIDNAIFKIAYPRY